MFEETFIREDGVEIQVITRDELLSTAMNVVNKPYVDYVWRIITQKTDVEWDDTRKAWLIPLDATPEQFNQLCNMQSQDMN